MALVLKEMLICEQFNPSCGTHSPTLCPSHHSCQNVGMLNPLLTPHAVYTPVISMENTIDWSKSIVGLYPIKKVLWLSQNVSLQLPRDRSQYSVAYRLLSQHYGESSLRSAIEQFCHPLICPCRRSSAAPGENPKPLRTGTSFCLLGSKEFLFLQNS